MRRALLSVSDKARLVEFARGLAARGFELVSTGGTARVLTEAGIRVTAVSDVTAFPEMMDGRVKTLHPNIHAGILARRDHPDDLEAVARYGIQPIDIVVVNLYPFAETAKQAGVSFADLVEQIDIGGPSLIRAAAKNFRDVLVVVDPADYQAVLENLDRSTHVSLKFRYDLARRAFTHTAAYDAHIAAALNDWQAGEDELVRICRPDDAFPEAMVCELAKLRDLRYGENPHQRAALYQGHPVGLRAWEILQGKELSYTNLVDLDAAVRVVLELMEPAAVVVKHTNPCGAATGEAIADAYVRARDADPLSAFGRVVALNRPIDDTTARAITSTFIEAVVAPSVRPSAGEILSKKSNMRVVTADFDLLAPDGPGRGSRELRSTLAGILVQQPDRAIEARDPWPNEAANLRVVTSRQPTVDEWRALRFAWTLCAHVKSNAVVFTGADRTLAIGAGQMSRVDAVGVAVLKAASQPGLLAGSVAASDGFFPFRDGLDAIAAAGATAVVQPGGSVRDAEVIAAADAHNLAMIFTGRRHFRH
jgi:phosphoribosylaminoimidazolecarboxamide formyltransferase/IMP cyclohydrolase